MNEKINTSVLRRLTCAGCSHIVDRAADRLDELEARLESAEVRDRIACRIAAKHGGNGYALADEILAIIRGPRGDAPKQEQPPALRSRPVEPVAPKGERRFDDDRGGSHPDSTPDPRTLPATRGQVYAALAQLNIASGNPAAMWAAVRRALGLEVEP